MFKVIQRTTQGEMEILYKKYLIVLVLLIHGYEAYWKHFQTDFMYVLYFSPWFVTKHCCTYYHQCNAEESCSMLILISMLMTNTTEPMTNTTEQEHGNGML